MNIRLSLTLPVILFVLFSCTLQPEQVKDVIFEDGKKHLLVMHPTVQNMERLIFLTESGIFPLPEDYRIVGVYHNDARYNYALTSEFILHERIGNMALYGIDAPIHEETIFSENELTDIFRDLFKQSEAVFFLGGPDIPPATYGEDFNLLTVVSDPYRHYLELSFLYHLVGGSQDTTFLPLMLGREDYGILGICLGMQSMNVASGGSLYQDIPTQVYEVFTVEDVLALDADEQHRNYHSYYQLDPDVITATFHRIRMLPNSHMAVITGDVDLMPTILSSHHQAVKDMGHGYRATATSPDRKIVEAIEHTVFPHVIGIQFHPEVPYLYDPEHILIFEPGQEGGYSFLQSYPGHLGEDFHRNFWLHIAAMLP